MICLKDLEKILEGKKGYQELLKTIDQKDFSSIEDTDSWYMKKFIEREEDRECIDSEKLLIYSKEIVRAIISGEIDVSGIKKLKHDTMPNTVALPRYFNKEEIKTFFSRFKSLESIDLGGSSLCKVDWGKDILREFARNPNLRSFELGWTNLHKVDWGKDVLLEFARNPNIRSIDLGYTKLHEVDRGKEVLEDFLRNSNLRSIDLGETALYQIPGGSKMLTDFIKKPNLGYGERFLYRENKENLSLNPSRRNKHDFSHHSSRIDTNEKIINIQDV